MATLLQRIVRVPFRMMSARAAFTHYYRTRSWGRDEESASGPGSSLARTEAVRRELPRVLQELGARSLLDVPCGDLYWINRIELPVREYIGGDIVEELIEDNRGRFGDGGDGWPGGPAERRFEVLDVTRDPLPRADVVLCRDCLVHLPLRPAAAALRNIVQGGSGGCKGGGSGGSGGSGGGGGARWLLATTFPGAVKANREVLTGGWRMLDLRLPPFDLPEPVREIDEQWPEYPQRRLGVWDLDVVRAGRT